MRAYILSAVLTEQFFPNSAASPKKPAEGGFGREFSGGLKALSVTRSDAYVVLPLARTDSSYGCASGLVSQNGVVLKRSLNALSLVDEEHQGDSRRIFVDRIEHAVGIHQHTPEACDAKL